jgi:predicted AlkP superfamily phosphohydrolase/phosphomutase
MSRNVLLIGLDGATFDLLDPLMADGVMPVLQQLVASGVRATLRSTVPALTPPAWTSLVSGRGPGAHGIFDFFRRDSATSPALRFLTSRDVECPTMWSLASDAGLRSTVLNFPSDISAAADCRTRGARRLHAVAAAEARVPPGRVVRSPPRRAVLQPARARARHGA